MGLKSTGEKEIIDKKHRIINSELLFNFDLKMSIFDELTSTFIFTHVKSMEQMSEKIVPLNTCQPQTNDHFD